MPFIDFEIDASGTPPKKKRQVGWSNFRHICAEIPPPSFDRKTASAEDWKSYSASLTDRQREAQSFRWVVSICAAFAQGFTGAGDRGRAFEFARARQPMIFEAFRERKSRQAVLAELESEFEAQK